MTCYIPRWFTRPQAATHPSTNRARCRLTSLIKPTLLTTTLCRHLVKWLIGLWNVDSWYVCKRHHGSNCSLVQTMDSLMMRCSAIQLSLQRLQSASGLHVSSTIPSIRPLPLPFTVYPLFAIYITSWTTRASTQSSWQTVASFYRHQSSSGAICQAINRR